MTVEYVLMLAAFALLLMGSIMNGPVTAFSNTGPKLAARIERHLVTGDGFHPGGQLVQWEQ